MSPRPPAWPGLSARGVSFVDAPIELAEPVVAALRQPGVVRLFAGAGSASAALMRFEPEQGEPLFLKLVPSHRSDALTEAEALASWLRGQGVRVVASDPPTALQDGRMLWSAPFHPGRLSQPTVADLTAIGSELARLHRALSEHPHRADWLQRTDQRLARLNDVRRALASGRLQAGPYPSRLQALAREATLGFEALRHGPHDGRTPLHGDLNLFNVLIQEDRCTFLDFEDVQHSVLPPVFDIATVYERVVLVHAPATAWGGLLEALLQAYEGASEMRVDPTVIPGVLRGLALRALCTLAGSDPAGQDETEWKKFFYLMDLSSP